MNRNTIILNAPVIFSEKTSISAKEFRLESRLSTLNGEIIKHDPCTLRESENMSGYPHTLVYPVQLLSLFVIKRIHGLKIGTCYCQSSGI